MEQMIEIDLNYELEPILVINAIETEDELGTVLRVHLLYENTLNLFLSESVVGDMNTYIKNPRDFGLKLAFSVALGLPTACAAVMKHVNAIRNDLAHGKKHVLDRNQVNTLARLVNEALESFPNNKEGKVQDWGINFSENGVSDEIKYRSRDLRIDFCIASISFVVTLGEYILVQAAEARVRRGQYAARDYPQENSQSSSEC